MSTALWVLAGLYLLSQRTATPPASPRPVATSTVSPTAGTRITIPGVGSYFNAPSGTSITLDPSFYGRFIPTQPFPESIAQPVAVPDYQAFDVISYPSDPYYACADPFAPCFA